MCACAQHLCRRLVVAPETITIVVVTCLDLTIMRQTPLKDKAVAMLHAMRLERIISLFIGTVDLVWRGRDVSQGEVQETRARTRHQRSSMVVSICYTDAPVVAVVSRS